MNESMYVPIEEIWIFRPVMLVFGGVNVWEMVSEKNNKLAQMNIFSTYILVTCLKLLGL